jgi:hypothetical protein
MSVVPPAKRVHVREEPIARRLGRSPRERCDTDCGCPDLFELADGNFAVIGTDLTDEIIKQLPADAGVGTHERIVVVRRDVLIAAKHDIPDR